jgi:hypothetical protein
MTLSYSINNLAYGIEFNGELVVSDAGSLIIRITSIDPLETSYIHYGSQLLVTLQGQASLSIDIKNQYQASFVFDEQSLLVVIR